MTKIRELIQWNRPSSVFVRKDESIGWVLLRPPVDYAKEEGIGELWGQIMYDNVAMMKMCREVSFGIKRSIHDVCDNGYYAVP